MKLTNDQRAVLLYLETCMVDGNHFADHRRMNAEDHAAIEKLMKQGIIEFGRLPAKVIATLQKKQIPHTHWVRFTDTAWKLAHEARRERALKEFDVRMHNSITTQTWNRYDPKQCRDSLEGPL